MPVQHLTTIAVTSCLMFLASFLMSLHLTRLWDNLLERRFRPFIERYLQLRMSEQSLRDGLRVWSLILFGGSLWLSIAQQAWPLAATWFLIVSVVPPYVLQAVIKRREHLLEYQLIASSTALANAVKAGLSVPQGLKCVAEETPAPLQAELTSIVYQFDHGRPLAETLSAVRQRLQLEPFTLFCLALEVATERGGRVNHAMERLSTSLQEWFRLRRKLSSDTSAGRYAVLIMALCPLAFILMFAVTGQDSVFLLFTDFFGQCVLAVIILLICLGIHLTNRIMDIRLN